MLTKRVPAPLVKQGEDAWYQLECSSCHKPQDNTVAADACAGCHGNHGSVRAGHAKALATRAMRCSTCHPIHQGDQGVSFLPGRPPIRFSPGVEVEVDPIGFIPERPTTVPIVTIGACKACHAPGDPKDPIARCVAPGQEALGDARPIACLDEHEIAQPDDSLRDAALEAKVDEWLKLRGIIYQQAIEPARAAKTIAKSLEAAVTLALPAPLDAPKDELEEFFIVSELTLASAAEPAATVIRSGKAQCPRCWRHVPLTPRELCERCAEAVPA